MPRQRFSIQHRGTAGLKVFHPRHSRKKHLDHVQTCRSTGKLHDARHCPTNERPLTPQTTATDEEFLQDGGFEMPKLSHQSHLKSRQS